MVTNEKRFSFDYYFRKNHPTKGKRNMKKITAILLALLLVMATFATVVMAEGESSADSSEAASVADSSVPASEAASSAESSTAAPEIKNIVAGKTYTVTVSDEAKEFYNGMCNDPDLKHLTDGVVRTGTDFTAGGAGVVGKTVEYAGTNRVFTITFDLGGAFDLTSVILDGIRRGNNRYTNLVKVEVSTGGAFTEAAFTEELVYIAGSEKYVPKVGDPGTEQFFTLTAKFNNVQKGIKSVKVTFDTAFTDAAKYNMIGARGYIAQIDEIMIMGTAAGGTTTPETSKETSTGTTRPPVAPPTGDIGITVFAILAVVSLAGVVVAKKSK